MIDIDNNLPLTIDSVSNIDEDTIFAEHFLNRHNELRKLHGAQELVLSSELITMACKWANKLSEKGHVAFAEISGVGENITVFPEDISAKEIVDYWYDENRKYEYETPGWQAGANYFTQIVWKSTREIGVSRVKLQLSFVENQQNTNKGDNSEIIKRNKSVIVVAFYRPAGNSNRSGQFALNVSKPLIDNGTTR
uniref:SCP domain-containing protein n=1 Tax=Meloidogyne incognita TaxID=6306 RepID=A0A914MPU6_MELIC